MCPVLTLLSASMLHYVDGTSIWGRTILWHACQYISDYMASHSKRQERDSIPQRQYHKHQISTTQWCPFSDFIRTCTKKMDTELENMFGTRYCLNCEGFPH
jgi:hypothetical protein